MDRSFNLLAGGVWREWHSSFQQRRKRKILSTCAWTFTHPQSRWDGIALSSRRPFHRGSLRAREESIGDRHGAISAGQLQDLPLGASRGERAAPAAARL